MKGTISSKGQITVPAAIRRELGLRTGAKVQFELRPGGVLLRKAHAGKHPGDRWIGSIQLPVSVDEFIDELRGPRPNRSQAP